MLTLLESAFRAAFVSCMIQRAAILFMDMAVPRKKKIGWLYIFMPAKTFFLVTCADYINQFYPGSSFAQSMYQIIDLAVVLLIMWFYVWVWEDEPLHILLLFLITDSITVPLVVVPVGINYLEGRADITQLEGPFQPLDMLIPPLILLITHIVRPHMKRLARFLGSIHLPHRQLLWFLIFMYVFAARMFRFLEGNSVPAVVIQSSIATVLIAGLLAQQVMFHLRFQREEEEFLDMQMNLLHQRAVVTQYSRTQLAETRKIITRQMQELDSIMESGSLNELEIDAKVLKDYLLEIQSAEETESSNGDQTGYNIAGYRGRYCRDILTDEMLSQISDYAEAHGNSITISLRNYETGRIADEDLARILYCLTYEDSGRRILYCLTYEDSGRRSTGKAGGERELYLTVTDDQLMIRMSANRLQIPRRRIIALQSVLKKYKGELSFTRSDGREEAYVILTV